MGGISARPYMFQGGGLHLGSKGFHMIDEILPSDILLFFARGFPFTPDQASFGQDTITQEGIVVIINLELDPVVLHIHAYVEGFDRNFHFLSL
jgi:hypothetical protein